MFWHDATEKPPYYGDYLVYSDDARPNMFSCEYSNEGWEYLFEDTSVQYWHLLPPSPYDDYTVAWKDDEEIDN